MLEPLRHILDKSAIVLASQSPRRREVLQNIGKLNIIIRPSNAEENLEKSKYEGKPFNYTMDTAALKTDAVFGEVEAEYGKYSKDSSQACFYTCEISVRNCFSSLTESYKGIKQASETSLASPYFTPL